jgi:hypothetical protein
MRYKTLVTTKLESLENSINRLNSLISQNTTRDHIQENIKVIKEKIQEVQTLINVEQQD